MLIYRWWFICICSLFIYFSACESDKTGFSVGNFGVGAQVSKTGGMFSHIYVNPSSWGAALKEVADGHLSINGIRDDEMKISNEHRTFPVYEGSWNNFHDMDVTVRSWAPLTTDPEGWNCFLPALYIDVHFQAHTKTMIHVNYTLTFDPEQISPDNIFLEILPSNGVNGIVAVNGKTIDAQMYASVEGELTATVLILFYDENGYYAEKLGSVSLFEKYLSQNVDAMRDEVNDFIAAIPSVGDPELDSYLRWYMSAGILLTKGTKTGEVITMGYVEFNQRDSFWASWEHLYFWPKLDMKMIMEAIQHQEPSGKIPTCILPLIERENDIDITEYFILRAARHFWYTGNISFLTQCWDAMGKGMGYLRGLALGSEGGIPVQVTFWADWKDVSQVSGRKYAPHFSLLCGITAFKDLSAELGLFNVSESYHKELISCSRYIDSIMWKSDHYADIWFPGKARSLLQKVPVSVSNRIYQGWNQTYILLDQSVGPFFSVVEESKVTQLLYTLKKNGEGKCGIRETYPYISGWGGEGPGNYHDGGIWPYLSFVDIANRYKYGMVDDADALFRALGRCSLVADSQYHPYEYMNGDTGENRGHNVQAWDSSAFAAVIDGFYNMRVSSTRQVSINLKNLARRPLEENPHSIQFLVSDSSPRQILSVKFSAEGVFSMSVNRGSLLVEVDGRNPIVVSSWPTIHVL